MITTPQIQLFRFLIGAQRRSIRTNASEKLPSHLRRPVRGGQNLSERYKRLENSIRGKEVLTRELVAKRSTGGPQKLTSPGVPTFCGFQVPKAPTPPADDECCMSGCAVCVYDIYEESLASYQEAVDTLRRSLVTMKVPESEWPSNIRSQTQANLSEALRKDTILSAFEEMERTLAKKHLSEQDTTRKLLQNERRNRLVHLETSRPLSLDLFEGIRWLLFSKQ